MRKLIAAIVLALVPGCYSSAQAAREDQTRHASGWYCADRPVVRCAGGPCTGHDQTWEASCPSSGEVFRCTLRPHVCVPR